MAWYPRAVRLELLPENRQQSAIRPTQLILHSIVAPWTPERLHEFWRDSTTLESHFGLGYDGDIAQYLSTTVRADANAAANRRDDGTGAISCETASNTRASDAWTDDQAEELARLGVWVHRTHDVPLRLCRTADDPGYGWHKLHRSWSTSGTACPGSKRVDQFKSEIFPEIRRRAQTTTVGGGDQADERPTVDLSKLIDAAKKDPARSGTPISYVGVGRVERALAAQGLLSEGLIDAHYGTATRDAYAAWQRRLGYSGSAADGIPGRASLAELGRRYGFDVKE